LTNSKFSNLVSKPYENKNFEMPKKICSNDTKKTIGSKNCITGGGSSFSNSGSVISEMHL